MKVRELFERLSYGELSNLSIGMDGSGQITEKGKPKLISYINDGLLNIYTRFKLKEDTLIIEQVQHITSYHLTKRFAESSESDEPYKYIKDLPGEPFRDDVIKIVEVYDSYGRPRILNDVENASSLFVPYPTELQVPYPTQGVALSVGYQARHDPLKKDGDVESQDIELPFILEGPLQSYVAYKVYSHMNGQENLTKAQEYFQTFETSCTDIEGDDTVNKTFSTTHDKLRKRGFV